MSEQTKKQETDNVESQIKKRVGTTKEQLEKIKWIDKQTMKEQFGAVHLVILFVLFIFLIWDIIAFGITSILG